MEVFWYLTTHGDGRYLGSSSGGRTTDAPHDQRYAQADAFLHVWREMLRGETVDFQRDDVDVRGGKVVLPGLQRPYPALSFGGSWPAAHEVAARHVDVYLTWGEPPWVAEKIAPVREPAALEGRTLRFGIRMRVIVRETEQEAWAAEALIRHVDQQAMDAAKQAFSRMDSVGQQRMLALWGSLIWPRHPGPG